MTSRITITGQIQADAWRDRVIPPVEEVRDGIWSVPIPFAGSPIRYTFSYVVVGTDGRSIVIDPGFDSPDGRERMTAALDDAGVGLRGVDGVLVTHLHPDHLGLAAWLADASGAWTGMHHLEAAVLADWNADHTAVESKDRRWLEAVGVPDGRLDDLLATNAVTEYMRAMAAVDRPLEDGDRVELAGRRLSVVHTPGHTPGHLCIVEAGERVVFTGDHVLPRISPNVGLTSTGRNDHALTRYYASLDRLYAWSDYEALPAHEYRFTGLGVRVAELAAHHLDRSAEILALLGADGSSTAWSLAERLTWSRSWEQLDGTNLRAALAEIASHLDDLRSRSAVTTRQHGGRVAWAVGRAEDEDQDQDQR